MDDQDEALEIDNIYDSIQEDVSSPLDWFLLLHLSQSLLSLFTKYQQEAKNKTNWSSCTLYLVLASLSWLLFVSHNISDFVLAHAHLFRNICTVLCSSSSWTLNTFQRHCSVFSSTLLVIGILDCITYLLQCWKTRHYWRFIIFIGK